MLAGHNLAAVMRGVAAFGVAYGVAMRIATEKPPPDTLTYSGWRAIHAAACANVSFESMSVSRVIHWARDHSSGRSVLAARTA